MTWTLTVNESGAKLKNAVVTDVLGDNLMLDAASVKLDDQDIGTNSAQKPYYIVEDNTLKFYLEDIDGSGSLHFHKCAGSDQFSEKPGKPDVGQRRVGSCRPRGRIGFGRGDKCEHRVYCQICRQL